MRRAAIAGASRDVLGNGNRWPAGQQQRDVPGALSLGVAVQQRGLGQPGQALADAAGVRASDALHLLQVFDGRGQQLLQAAEILDEALGRGDRQPRDLRQQPVPARADRGVQAVPAANGQYAGGGARAVAPGAVPSPSSPRADGVPAASFSRRLRRSSVASAWWARDRRAADSSSTYRIPSVYSAMIRIDLLTEITG